MSFLEARGVSALVDYSYGATEAWVLYDPACDGSKITAYGVYSGHTSDLGFAVGQLGQVLRRMRLLVAVGLQAALSGCWRTGS